MANIEIADAISRATARGLSAILLTGCRKLVPDGQISITTSDPSPSLSWRSGSRYLRVETPLHSQGQAGPDTWDFALPEFTSDFLVLRISNGMSQEDLLVLPAAHALIAAYGWIDDLSQLAPPVVRAQDLADLLHKLSRPHDA